jgi:hypothetical protein
MRLFLGTRQWQLSPRRAAVITGHSARASGEGQGKPRLRAVLHDAVVGAAGASRAGTRTVAGQHLRGTPPVQLHQVPLRPAPVQPRVAEMMPEPVRIYLHPALASPAGDDLVDPGRGQRPAEGLSRPMPPGEY